MSSHFVGARRFGLLAAAVWLLLATACSNMPGQQATAGDDARRVRSPVPARIVEDMARLSGRPAAELAPQIELREVELAPKGARSLIASLGDRACPEMGCPFGVFASASGEYRPLLLIMGNAEPQVLPVAHLGYADMSASEVVSATELRLTRHQWDGWAYGPAACRLIDRITNAARACAPRFPSEATLVESLPSSQCGEAKAMVSAAPAQLRTRALLTSGFVVRSDELAHVEAIKVKGQMDADGPAILLRCLRESGADLKRVPPAAAASDLKTQQWASPAARLRWGKAAVSVTQTYVPRHAYTLVSVGVFVN
jgi:hypothetical protein